MTYSHSATIIKSQGSKQMLFSVIISTCVDSVLFIIYFYYI